MKTSRVLFRFLGIALAASSLIACGDKVVSNNATSSAKPANAPAPAAAAPGTPAAVGPDGGAMVAPKMDFTENDFAESDRNRDPFRTYLSALAPDQKKDALKSQHEIVLGQYSLDELKLVAIVMGGEYPRAMVVDPGGKGWVLKKGDWVGRPEVVHVGGANGADYSVGWRVDKVRDGEIVFSREDPAQPGIPPASRIIALRPDNEPGREKL